MPNESFTVRIDEWREIHALPGSWDIDQLRTLLQEAEFDDQVDDGDVEEMALMALQDLGVREASDLVLRQVFGGRMSAGVRQNLVSELEEDRPWEQFADVATQADIFRAVTLLQKAFPNAFGTPDAVRLRVTVRASDAETSGWLSEGPEAGLIARLLAGGMSEGAVLRRLYEDELAGKRFDVAQHILWRVALLEPASAALPVSAPIEVISSHQWLDPLEHAGEWVCRAWPDEAS